MQLVFLLSERTDLERILTLFDAEWKATVSLKEALCIEVMKQLDNDVLIILCFERVRSKKSTMN